MAKKGDLSLRAYKHEVQAICLQIVKYYKAVEDKDTLFAEYSKKFFKMEDGLLDKSLKLEKTNSYYFK